MAWSLVSVGPNITSTLADIDLSTASGTVEGDLLIAFITYRGFADMVLPTGGEWTVVAHETSGNDTAGSSAGIANLLIAYCIRGASYPNDVFTRASAEVAQGRVIAYRSDMGGAPVLNSAVSATLGTAATAFSLSGGITVADGDLIVAMGAGGRNGIWSDFDANGGPSTGSGGTVDTTTNPTVGTWILRGTQTTTGGADTSYGVADGIRSVAGSTSTIFATCSNSARHAIAVASFTETAAPPSDSDVYLGADNISVMYVGADEVDAAYLGSDQIF